MTDRLGVLNYPVDVTPVSGQALTELQNRLNVMEREAKDVLTAVREMKNGVHAKNSRLLTDGVMNSRNWALSVVMSHCFIQTLLGANPGRKAGYNASLAKFQLYDLFIKAAQMGSADGIDARVKFNVRPSESTAALYWRP